MRDAATHATAEPNAAIGATIPLTPHGQMTSTPSGAPRRGYMQRQHQDLYRATPQTAGSTSSATPAPSAAPAATPLPEATYGQGTLTAPMTQPVQAGPAAPAAMSLSPTTPVPSATPTGTSNGQGSVTAPAAQPGVPRRGRTRTAAIPVARTPVSSQPAADVPALAPGAAAPAIRGADAVRQLAPTAQPQGTPPSVTPGGSLPGAAAASARRLRKVQPIAGVMQRTLRRQRRLVRPATGTPQRSSHDPARTSLQVPASRPVHAPAVAAAAPEHQSAPARTMAATGTGSANEAAPADPSLLTEQAAHGSSDSSLPAVQLERHVPAASAGPPDAGPPSRSHAVTRPDRRPTRQILLQARNAGPTRASATTSARTVERPGAAARANRRPQLTVLRVPSRRNTV